MAEMAVTASRMPVTAPGTTSAGAPPMAPTQKPLEKKKKIPMADAPTATQRNPLMPRPTGFAYCAKYIVFMILSRKNCVSAIFLDGSDQGCYCQTMMTIGKRLKELRQERDWTLADVAKRSEVALSSLSRIETGRMTGTLESHIQIAKAFGIRMAELYADLDSTAHPVEIHCGTSGKGAHLTLLTKGNLNKRKMLPALVSLAAGKSTPLQCSSFGSEKFLYLLKGKVELNVGQERFVLQSGESAYVQVSVSHQMKNVGSGAAEILSISSPPSA